MKFKRFKISKSGEELIIRHKPFIFQALFPIFVLLFIPFMILDSSGSVESFLRLLKPGELPFLLLLFCLPAGFVLYAVVAFFTGVKEIRISKSEISIKVPAMPFSKSSPEIISLENFVKFNLEKTDGDELFRLSAVLKAGEPFVVESFYKLEEAEVFRKTVENFLASRGFSFKTDLEQRTDNVVKVSEKQDETGGGFDDTIFSHTDIPKRFKVRKDVGELSIKYRKSFMGKLLFSILLVLFAFYVLYLFFCLLRSAKPVRIEFLLLAVTVIIALWRQLRDLIICGEIRVNKYEINIRDIYSKSLWPGWKRFLTENFINFDIETDEDEDSGLKSRTRCSGALYMIFRGEGSVDKETIFIDYFNNLEEAEFIKNTIEKFLCH